MCLSGLGFSFCTTGLVERPSQGPGFIFYLSWLRPCLPIPTATATSFQENRSPPALLPLTHQAILCRRPESPFTTFTEWSLALRKSPLWLCVSPNLNHRMWPEGRPGPPPHRRAENTEGGQGLVEGLERGVKEEGAGWRAQGEGGREEGAERRGQGGRTGKTGGEENVG